MQGQTFNSVLDVTSTYHKNIVVSRIGLDSIAARIILVYAPQETDNLEVREEFFTELEIEINECKINGEMPFVIGDMNAKLISENGDIKSNSYNGKLLLDIVSNQDLKVLNFDSKCNGKWTHVIRTTGSSSVLDYAITSSELAKHVKVVIIDEECVFCPFSLKKMKGKAITQYSDHNAVITTLEIPYTKRKIPDNHHAWKLTKEGLETFHIITSAADFPTEVEGETSGSKYDNYEKLLFDNMDKCFRRTKGRKDQKTTKEFLPLYQKVMRFAKRGKAQRKVARTYVQAIKDANIENVAMRNKENIRTTLQNLTIDSQFSPNCFWELCKKVRKTNKSMGTSVITMAGNEVFGEDMIRDAYKNEFLFRLREREIDPRLKNYEERSKTLCNLYLEHSKTMKMPDYSDQELLKVTKNLKKGKSYGRDKIPPEIPLMWGDKLASLTLNVMNHIKNSQKTPEQWTNVLISTIYKNKGLRKMLINHRGIFLKLILSKVFGKLNMNRIEQNVQNIDLSQAGSRQKRGPADQTFLLRGSIDHSKYLNRPIYLVLYDYSQCFDSLWLDDCLLSLWKLGVQNETLNLIRDMNRTCNIVVKTPVGLTEEFRIDDIVQQGSVSGSTLCSASTAEVTSEIKSGGSQIGTCKIKCLVYVDDIITVNNSVADVYHSHGRVQWFSKKKRLGLNGPKCMLLGVNLKSSDVVPLLKVSGTIMESKQVVSYLGDLFNNKGTNSDLVDDRIKKGKCCIITSMSLCSDVTMGLHAIETLLLLYRSLFIAVVLYNAQAWSNVSISELKSLQTVQLRFLKRIFHAPSSSSNPLTFLETGTLPIKYEIHVRQLGFLHHILTLTEKDPVKHAYQQQLKFSMASNWANEVAKIRNLYSITEEDTEVANLSKRRWKKIVRIKVVTKALVDLNQEMSQQKHAQNLVPYTKLSRQQYLDTLPPNLARKVFHIRTGTIDLRGVRKYKYGDNTGCRLCLAENETVEHVVNACPKIHRTTQIDDIYTTKCEDLQEVAKRCIDFDSKLDDQSDT